MVTFDSAETTQIRPGLLLYFFFIYAWSFLSSDCNGVYVYVCLALLENGNAVYGIVW